MSSTAISRPRRSRSHQAPCIDTPREALPVAFEQPPSTATRPWYPSTSSASLLVGHIMSTPVVTFFGEQTLPLAEEVMSLHRFRHLPVVDSGGRLIGLVTHRDLLRGQISVLTGLTRRQRRAREEDIQIRQLMTRDVWTVTPDTLACHAGQTLLDHRFGCLPVIDADRILCGIVTERDFLRFAITALDGQG